MRATRNANRHHITTSHQAAPHRSKQISLEAVTTLLLLAVDFCTTGKSITYLHDIAVRLLHKDLERLVLAHSHAQMLHDTYTHIDIQHSDIARQHRH